MQKVNPLFWSTFQYIYVLHRADYFLMRNLARVFYIMKKKIWFPQQFFILVEKSFLNVNLFRVQFLLLKSLKFKSFRPKFNAFFFKKKVIEIIIKVTQNVLVLWLHMYISIIYTTTKLICVNRGKHRKTLVEYYFNGIFNAIKRYFCM